jgi:hypothetical protein
LEKLRKIESERGLPASRLIGDWIESHVRCKAWGDRNAADILTGQDHAACTKDYKFR